jgi:hypothetical protein
MTPDRLFLEYSEWDTKQLQNWLEQHRVNVPQAYYNSKEDLQNLVAENWWSYTAWTDEQYNNAQRSFQNLKHSTFESWDESRLREFLLEQGIVEPKGPKEKLVLLAKNHYNAYKNAGYSLSSTVTDTVSSLVATSTDGALRAFDDSKDYVYSTWDDSQMKDHLVSRGVLKSNAQKTRDQYLKLMKENYADVANPVWQAWSDSYIVSFLTTLPTLFSADFRTARLACEQGVDQDGLPKEPRLPRRADEDLLLRFLGQGLQHMVRLRNQVLARRTQRHQA